MHIHPISPTSDSSDSLEDSAAAKIQAGFRGYRVRKQLSHYRQQQQQQQPITRNHLQRLYKQQQQQRLHKRAMEASKSNMNGDKITTAANSDDKTIEDRCATKIQAGVRGFLVRKKQQKATEAATKIQAGFRGFKARKETQRLKQN